MASQLQRVIIDITITADEYIKYYQGSAQIVSGTSIDGRRVQFPANLLKPYVSRKGISGRFAIYFDADGKFQKIDKL